MNKSIVYLIYFTGYTLLLLFFGKSGFKKTNNIRDFFVAGNSLGLTASIFTFCATWFSAASVQGVTGSLYAYGYSTIFYSIIPWFIGAVLLILLSTKLKEYEILTIPEFFYFRYNSKLMQSLGGIMIVVTYTLYITIQIRGFGIVISELLDINYLFSIVLIYLFIIYTTFGGLFSVSKTHVLNFILVAAGVIIASLIVMNNAGGFAEINKKASLINTRPFPSFPHITEKGGMLDSFANGQMPPLLVFTSFFGWGLGLAANPQYAIRIVSAKNKNTAIKMICYSLTILAVLYFCLLIIGLGGRTLAPNINSIKTVDEVFPYMIDNIIYSPFSGLILIGIVAASISTANSQLLLASSGFTYDLYKNLINANIEEEHLLNFNRVFIFAVGTVSLFLAVNPPESLLFYGGNLWAHFSATFLVPLYGGLFWKKATKEGAIASFAAGLITLIIFTNLNISSSLNPAFPSVIVSAAMFYIISSHFYNIRRI